MSLIGTCITEANHAEWLAERRTSIGSSDAASVLGIGHETPLGVYLEKVGQVGEKVETEEMRWGKRLESAIADAYQDRTGIGTRLLQRFVRSPVHTFMTATLDCVRDDGLIVELKSVGAHMSREWGESGTDEVPPAYLVQVMHQMVVTGTDLIDCAVLIGGQEFRTFTIRWDDRIARHLVDVEAEFWDRVTRRDPPPVNHARDAAAMSRLWPHAEGEMDLGPIGRTLVEEWEEHGREAHRHGAAKGRCKVALLDILQDCASARIGDGRLLTRKIIKVSEKQITHKGYEFVDLKIRKER